MAYGCAVLAPNTETSQSTLALESPLDPHWLPLCEARDPGVVTADYAVLSGTVLWESLIFPLLPCNQEKAVLFK